MKTAIALLALCFAVFVVTVYAAKPIKLDLDARAQFLAFQRKYNKTYATNEEFQLRFTIFQQSLVRAAQEQLKNPKARFGVTKFSDLSPEEFRGYYLLPEGSFANYVAPPAKTVFDPTPGPIGITPDPTNFDWGSSGCVTPVYNQGQCGSCWAFSATETIESYWCLAGNALTQLSMEQIVDCDTNGNDEGCGGGFPTGAYSYVEGAGGIEDYNDYPYTAGGGESGSCNYNQADDVCTVSGYTSIDGESGLYQQLSSGSGGPVSVCVDASSWQYYQGGVLTSCGDSVDHCVQATGYYNYGSSNAYWNVRNSWAADWGENGYIWIAIGQDLCSIGDYATVVTTGSA
jgi:cysteine peptidase B